MVISFESNQFMDTSDNAIDVMKYWDENPKVYILYYVELLLRQYQKWNVVAI